VEGGAVTDLQSTLIENWLEASGEILAAIEYFPAGAATGQRLVRRKRRHAREFLARDFRLLRDAVGRPNRAVAQLLRKQTGVAGEQVRGGNPVSAVLLSLVAGLLLGLWSRQSR